MSSDRIFNFIIIAMIAALFFVLAMAGVTLLHMNKLEDACTAAGGTPIRTNSTTLCVKEFMPLGKR